MDTCAPCLEVGGGGAFGSSCPARVSPCWELGLCCSVSEDLSGSAVPQGKEELGSFSGIFFFHVSVRVLLVFRKGTIHSFQIVVPICKAR